MEPLWPFGLVKRHQTVSTVDDKDLAFGCGWQLGTKVLITLCELLACERFGLLPSFLRLQSHVLQDTAWRGRWCT